MINRIKNLDSHDAFFLLKNCLAIPKILFFLRSAPLYTCQFLNEFDHAIKKGLEFICNIAINDNKWMQLTLPVKFGGMGIRSFQKIALPAFISSFHKSKSIAKILSPTDFKDVVYEDCELAEAEWFRIPGISNEDRPKVADIQANWDLPLCKIDFNTLLVDATLEIGWADFVPPDFVPPDIVPPDFIPPDIRPPDE